MAKNGISDIMHNEDVPREAIDNLEVVVHRVTASAPPDSDSGNASLMETSHGVVDSIYDEDLILGNTCVDKSRNTNPLFIPGKKLPTRHDNQVAPESCQRHQVSHSAHGQSNFTSGFPQVGSSINRDYLSMLSCDTSDTLLERGGLSDYAAKLNLDIVPLIWSFERLLHCIPIGDVENMNKKDTLTSYSVLLKGACGKIIQLIDSLLKLGHFHNVHANNLGTWTNSMLFSNFETSVLKDISKSSISHLNKMCTYMEGLNDKIKETCVYPPEQSRPDTNESDATQFPRTRWIPRGTRKIWFHDPEEFLRETTMFRVPTIEKNTRLPVDVQKGLLTPSSTPDSLTQEYSRRAPAIIVQQNRTSDNISFGVHTDGQVTSTPATGHALGSAPPLVNQAQGSPIQSDPLITVKEEVIDSPIETTPVFPIYNDRAPDALVQPSSSGSISDSRAGQYSMMDVNASNISCGSPISICSEVPSLNISLSSDSDRDESCEADECGETDSKDFLQIIGCLEVDTHLQNKPESTNDKTVGNISRQPKPVINKPKPVNQSFQSVTYKKGETALQYHIKRVSHKSKASQLKRLQSKTKSHKKKIKPIAKPDVVSTVGNVIYKRKYRERKESKKKDGAVIAPINIGAHTRVLRNNKYENLSDKAVVPMCQSSVDPHMPDLISEPENTVGSIEINSTTCGIQKNIETSCYNETERVEDICQSPEEPEMPHLRPEAGEELSTSGKQSMDSYSVEDVVGICEEHTHAAALEDLQDHNIEDIPAPKIRVLLQRIENSSPSHSTEASPRPEKSQPLSSQMIDSVFSSDGETLQSVDELCGRSENQLDMKAKMSTKANQLIPKQNIVLNRQNLKSLLVKAVSTSKSGKTPKYRSNEPVANVLLSQNNNMSACSLEGSTIVATVSGTQSDPLVPSNKPNEYDLSDRQQDSMIKEGSFESCEPQEVIIKAKDSLMKMSRVKSKGKATMRAQTDASQTTQADPTCVGKLTTSDGQSKCHTQSKITTKDSHAKTKRVTPSVVAPNKVHDPKDVYNVLLRLQASETYIYIVDDGESTKKDVPAVKTRRRASKGKGNSNESGVLKSTSAVSTSNVLKSTNDIGTKKTDTSIATSNIVNTVFTEDMPVMIVGREGQKNFMTFGQLVGNCLSREINPFTTEGVSLWGKHQSDTSTTNINATSDNCEGALYVDSQKWVPLNKFQVKMAPRSATESQNKCMPCSSTDVSASSSSVTLPDLCSTDSNTNVSQPNCGVPTMLSAGLECRLQSLANTVDESQGGCLHMSNSLRDVFSPELSNNSSESISSPVLSLSGEVLALTGTLSASSCKSSTVSGKSCVSTRSSLSSHEFESKNIPSGNRTSKSNEALTQSLMKHRPNVTHKVQIKKRRLSHNATGDHHGDRVEGHQLGRPLLFESPRRTHNSKVSQDNRPSLYLSQLDADTHVSGKKKLEVRSKKKTAKSIASAAECDEKPKVTEDVETTELQSNKKKAKFSKKDFVISPDEVLSSPSRRGFKYKEVCSQLVNDVYNHSKSDPFRHEVKSEELPQYYKIVKYPMCLDIMASRLRNLTYTDLETFVSDMRRIFCNWQSYYKSLGSGHGLAVTERVLKFFNAKLERALPDKDFSHITGSPQHCKNVQVEGTTRRSQRRTGSYPNQETCSRVSIPYELKQLLG